MYTECFLCHQYCDTEKHHIFGGALRKKSEKYKLTVQLCPTATGTTKRVCTTTARRCKRCMNTVSVRLWKSMAGQSRTLSRNFIRITFNKEAFG